MCGPTTRPAKRRRRLLLKRYAVTNSPSYARAPRMKSHAVAFPSPRAPIAIRSPKATPPLSLCCELHRRRSHAERLAVVVPSLRAAASLPMKGRAGVRISAPASARGLMAAAWLSVGDPHHGWLPRRVSTRPSIVRQRQGKGSRRTRTRLGRKWIGLEFQRNKGRQMLSLPCGGN